MAAVTLGEGLSLLIEALPKKTPELKKLFVIPCLLYGRLPADRRPTPTSRETADVLGIGLAVEVFEFADEAAAKAAWDSASGAFEACGIAVEAGDAVNETFAAPALVLKTPLAEERFEDGGSSEKDDYLAVFRTAIDLDMRTMARFSKATGLRVRYCMGRYMTQPPHAAEDGVINLLIGQRPPGHYRAFSVKVRNLFGMRVWSDGEERMVHGPVQWRGRTIDAEGVPVFQVIGNNYYQTVLMHSDHGNGFERSMLWAKMLSLLARDLEQAPEAAHAGTEDIEAAAAGMASRRADELGDALRKLEFELGDLQQQMAEKLRKREEKIGQLKALRRETADVADRCRADFDRLRAMEGVADARIDAEDGLLVVTDPIALERDGRRYALGAFRIHVATDGAIAVWSEDPKHPKGHHHPHVDRVSLECFGDITLAVTKLASAYRFAEAVTMILRWLRSYRPETTLIPLEEFPSEPIAKGAARETKPAPEPLAAAQAAGPQGRASGHADRRRRDRKPRRRGARQDGRA